MIWSKSTIVAIVLVLGSAAGCTYPEASANDVRFSGDIERVDGQFRMNGSVHIHGTNSRNIGDVAVVLYDQNRTVIDRIHVGSVSSHSEGPYPIRQPVRFTIDRLPTYVVIESPAIWTNGVASEGFHWTGDYYTGYWVRSEDERFRQA